MGEKLLELSTVNSDARRKPKYAGLQAAEDAMIRQIKIQGLENH